MKLPIPAQCPANATEAFETLVNKDKLELEDLKILALVEASGKALYGAVARLTDNEQIRTLLNKNGQEEVGHAHRILKAIAMLSGDHFELPDDSENPLTGDSSIETLSPDLMQFFIKAELEGEQHYNRWADNEPNADVAKIYRRIGADERRHSERDQQVLEILNSH